MVTGSIRGGFSRPALLIVAATALGFLVTCSPDFRSGVTKCTGGQCPSGYSCVAEICYSSGSAPDAGTADVAVDAVVLGTGGKSVDSNTGGKGSDTGKADAGAGGAGGGAGSPAGVGGAGGGAVSDSGAGGGGGTPSVDAGPTPPPACMNPAFPQYCPPKGGNTGGCYTANTDCATLGLCGTEEVGCAKGEMVNCMYPNVCSPIGNTCSNPARPKFCPAAGGAGPGCWAMDRDCTTVAACKDGAHACAVGRKLDCNYLSNPCSPIDGKCTNPMFPKFCPAAGGAGPDCFSEASDCTTLAACKDELEICRTGEKVDCKYTVNRCVAATPTCADPMFPDACPAAGVIGPGCYSKGVDCSTLVICEGELKGCLGTTSKYDCAMKKCVPK